MTKAVVFAEVEKKMLKPFDLKQWNWKDEKFAPPWKRDDASRWASCYKKKNY